MDKGSVVRDLFDRIAGRYDMANRVMTGGMDGIWRRQAAALIDVPNDARLLDLCCGTGALAQVLARKVPEGEVVGIDFSPLLFFVRPKLLQKQLLRHQFQIRVCEELLHGQCNLLDVSFKGEMACVQKLHSCIRIIAPKGLCAGGNEIRIVLAPDCK